MGDVRESSANLTMEHAVVRAIEIMQERMEEPLTVTDLASAAMYSKFHFSRNFQRVTGISPGRYLSALRLQAAKGLLVTTRMTVTEISHRVGYSSVGTFSTRFTRCVGLAPTMFRRRGGFAHPVPPASPPRGAGRLPVVRGYVRSPELDEDSMLFVGLYPTPTPEGHPVRCTMMDADGPFVLDQVPPGTWYVTGYRTVLGGPSVDARVVALAMEGPLTVRQGLPMMPLDLRLHPVSALDPPVLPAFPDARSMAFHGAA
ncbi:AraC family transcriptional regulator [Streptomyces sp. V4-01]|uniref:AraC family transcriptional regulator n=1 Tax=Actinacidiphila polyblastidii TaxID=3110430 RepID=A0ABU7P6A2_9ACTN|nr:AraC family transcriptional regulator [Streptomyces sp. V4-01]